MGQDVVLEGEEGFLFLSGGRHNPLRFAQASDAVKPESLMRFWANIQQRQAQLERRGIRFAHLIAPDKHSVCQEVFPVEVKTSLGERYLAAAPDPDLLQWVTYPRQQLANDFRRHCYRVDTHYRPSGTLVMLRELLALAGGPDAVQLLPTDEQLSFSSREAWAGDLGSKLSPAWTEDCKRLILPHSVQHFCNTLPGGNNGIIDLYINLEKSNPSTHQPSLGRVLVSGDSYGRDIARALALICQEVLFVRTPFLHIDLADAMQPDLVITENAERYLSNVTSDEDRPVFFLYPFLKDNSYAMSPQMASTLSAVLSFGRPPYAHWLKNLQQEIDHRQE